MIPRIAFVITYFGKLPIWFPAFLASCGANADFTFLIYTDQEIDAHPINVKVFSNTLASIARRASELLGFGVDLKRPYKLCDLKPAFGVVFADDLAGYDYWGHCDIDMIFGDLRRFIGSDIRAGADIVSARKELMCGHFTLYRNCPWITRLFLRDERFPRLLNSEDSAYFDEVGMTELVRRIAIPEGAVVCWPTWRFNYLTTSENRRGRSALPPVRRRWQWREGRLFHRPVFSPENEIMYLHFMNWKRSLRICPFTYMTAPREFSISFDAIEPNTGIEKGRKRLYPLRDVLDVLKQYTVARIK